MTQEQPANPEAVRAALTARFDTLPTQLQRAARYVIDNPRETGMRSMRTLTAKADVRPNTLIRLAREIGFDGFDACGDF